MTLFRANIYLVERAQLEDNDSKRSNVAFFRPILTLEFLAINSEIFSFSCLLLSRFIEKRHILSFFSDRTNRATIFVDKSAIANDRNLSFVTTYLEFFLSLVLRILEFYPMSVSNSDSDKRVYRNYLQYIFAYIVHWDITRRCKTLALRCI